MTKNVLVEKKFSRFLIKLMFKISVGLAGQDQSGRSTTFKTGQKNDHGQFLTMVHSDHGYSTMVKPDHIPTLIKIVFSLITFALVKFSLEIKRMHYKKNTFIKNYGFFKSNALIKSYAYQIKHA